MDDFVKIGADSGPILSIVTPTYNSMSYLDQTAESVLYLDMDYEWIIVDDGSIDGTREYVEQLASTNDRVIPVFNEVRAGRASPNYRKGLAISRGKYVIVLDHDDIIVDSGSISESIKLLEQYSDKSGIAISKVGYMSPSSQIYKIKAMPFARYGRIMSGQKLFWTIMLWPTYPIKQGAVVADRILYDLSPGLFDVRFMLNASRMTDVILVDRVGLGYRNHPKSLSSGGSNRSERIDGLAYGELFIPNNKYLGLKYVIRTYRNLVRFMKSLYRRHSFLRI